MGDHDFYSQLQTAMRLDPSTRHARLLALHREAVDLYERAIGFVSEGRSTEVQPGAEDRRSIAEIVAHIEGWDRFALMAAGDLVAGIRHPRMVTDLSGYLDPAGMAVPFSAIDEFNAYQSSRVQAMTWRELQSAAVKSAKALYAMFEHPNLANANCLEASDLHWKRLQNGVILKPISMGWHLWITMVEHIGVEHRSLLEWLGT